MDAAIGNFSGQLWSYLIQWLCLPSFSPAQSRWKEAVDKDSCVADQAATVSYSEVSCIVLSTHRLDNDAHATGICTSNGSTHVHNSQQHTHR